MSGRVAVIVPAHDEVDRVAAAVEAIGRACGELPAGIGRTVVIVADACRDGTGRAAIAALRRASRAIAGPGRPADLIVVHTEHRCVGAARRAGTAHALAAIGGAPARVWLANTDADSVVPRGWLREHLAAATDGVAGLAGTVSLDGGEGHRVAVPAPLRRAFECRYRIEPDGSHAHVHGANLGVRADAYLAVGGWRPVATGEDRDLWARLQPFWPVRSTSRQPVVTSARTRGRAPAGFAADLARLTEERS